MKNHTKGYITSWLRGNYLLYIGRCGVDYAYVCKLCSMPLLLQDTGYDHFYEKHGEWYDLPWVEYCYCCKGKEKMTVKVKRLTEGNVRIAKPLRRVYLKPWRDPNSFFCDTEFLEKLVGKKLVKGDECKNKCP